MANRRVHVGGDESTRSLGGKLGGSNSHLASKATHAIYKKTVENYGYLLYAFSHESHESPLPQPLPFYRSSAEPEVAEKVTGIC